MIGDRARKLSTALARTPFHAMALLDIQFCAGDVRSPTYLGAWRTSGAVVAPIAATPYPDERYRTKMMWYDRRTFANHAAPDQIPKILGRRWSRCRTRPGLSWWITRPPCDRYRRTLRRCCPDLSDAAVGRIARATVRPSGGLARWS